jgi:hexosaminidase
MSKTGLILLFILLSLFSSSQKLNIIPEPVSVKIGKGNFILSKKTVIAARDEEDRKAAGLFNEYLKNYYGFELDIDRQESKDYIRISTKKFIRAPDKDAYQLTINKNGVTIDGDTYAGSFYGLQTLIQLLPLPTNKQAKSYSLPQLEIIDSPRFNYRGMHLDVARHFFPVSFVKKYIDYLALHKMNTFHWHLTDDQGWRIEIKKYPNLMSRGAFRHGTIIGRYPGTANDNIHYGGFYTHEEIKDVIAYATSRHINVIPEVEMPGHSSAAIASYPWLSCFPEKPTLIPTHPSEKTKTEQANGIMKQVQESWGVYEDVFCAGKDSTFIFLQDVLDEVVNLFPSNYIHVGGDESPKNHWKKCPNCQARMKAEGLKDEHQLQSYFIQRIEKHLNSKGRILIGWDEILEGGLAPNAVVMSWRGEKGGIEAAKQNHQVIMSPQNPVYFDHTQTRTEDSIVFGGFNPLENVYNYEPLPKEIEPGKEKFVLGAQANVWTEYMQYPSKVEYMIFPRMSALSEVLWSGKNKRNWSQFQQKLMTQFSRYELWNASYSKAYFDLVISVLPTARFNGIAISAVPRDKKGSIQLKKKGQPIVSFPSSLLIQKSDSIEISYLRNNNIINKVPLGFSFNKATGKKISVSKPSNSVYPGRSGAFSLVNGIVSPRGLGYPDWMGWIGDDLEATIDLGKTESFTTIRLHTLDQKGSWIYLPQYVEIMVSNDGKNFTSAGRGNAVEKDVLTLAWMTVTLPVQKGRYIKIVAKNNGIIGEGMPGAGNKAWIFADEIQVN